MVYNLAKTGAQIDAIHTKVDGIEASADVTDATNVAAAGGVLNTGNETIAGVKTFSSSPVVPAPSTDLQAATKKYVDDNAGGSPEGTAVLSTGETVGKVLQADGDNTCSWVTLAGGGDALTANPLSQFAATTSAQLAGTISDETGSGALVFATSPTLVTPLLGTPTSGVLTNCTGTAAGLTAGAVTNGVVTTDNLSVMAATTSAQLAGVISDETGSGSLVFGTSPTLVTPALGTPASGVLTNCTGTAAGLTAGAVTNGVVTTDNLSVMAATTSSQLAGVISDETGSGSLVFGTSPTLVTPALGTPSSGVLTNCTGTASGLTAGNVTTNANLTGHVTSVGNAAVLGSFTKAQLNTAVSDATVATTAGTETLTNKTIAAGDNTATIFTEKHASSHTLSAAECYGAVYYVTAAATLTLPAVADGMHLTVITIGAVAVSVDANASDLIYLDGTALDDGDKITNLSTAGDIAVLTYYDATGWHASTNGWSDGS